MTTWNRLCTEIAMVHGWAIVNAIWWLHYTEGALKPHASPLRRRTSPGSITIVPTAGETILPKTAGHAQRADRDRPGAGHRGKDLFRWRLAGILSLRRFTKAYDIIERKSRTRSPKALHRKSGDGYYAARGRALSAAGAKASHREIVDAIKLPVKMEGDLTEPVGGTTLLLRM